jgi:PAS domain S-box-containing protein
LIAAPVAWGLLRKLWQRQSIASSLLQATLDSVSDGILVVDRSGKITNYNLQFCKLWRVSEELMRSGDDNKVLAAVLEQLTNPEQFITKVRSLYQNPETESFDEIHFQDGRIFERISRPLRAENKAIGRVWSFHEVTENRKDQSKVEFSEVRYRTLFEASPSGFLRQDESGKIIEVNKSICQLTGYSREELIGNSVNILTTPRSAKLVAEHLQKILAGGVHLHEVENLTKSGQTVFVKIVETCIQFPDGHREILCNVTDVTERKQTELLMDAQKNILEMVATDRPQAEVLATLCHFVESQNPGMLASLLLLDEDGKRLRHGAAPSLPSAYCQAIDGIEIGPEVGSCGTAAFFQKQVVVENIATDPLWKNFCALAAKYELAACWSTPVSDAKKNLLGTFAIYSQKPARPTPGQMRLIEIVTHIAALAIAKQHAQAKLTRLAAIVESSSDAIIGKNLEGVITSWNRGAELIFGYTAEEAIGQSLIIIFPPDRIEEENKILARIKNGETIKYFETIRTRKDGQRINISATTSPIRDSSGKIIGASKIARDITEQMLNKEKISREQARFKFIFDSVPIGIAFQTFHANGSVSRAVNKAHLRLTGLTPERHEENGIYARITHPEDWVIQQQFKQQVLAGNLRQFTMEKRYLHADGKVVWVNFSYQREIYSDGTIDELTTAFDITERRRLEDQLRQSQKMEAIGQLSGGIAHDFNNILTAILGNATLLSDPQAEPQEITESAQEIIRATRRAADLTRQLLLFSRKQAIQPVVVDLNNILSQSIKMLGRILGEDITLHSEYAPSLPPIFADVGMMEQVILNLAVNARDAMPEGGRLSLATTMALVKSPEAVDEAEIRPHVCLTVSDNGQGIAPEILPHIFEPFFTTKAVGKGTGLGLATVYGIVRQHNGWITINSQVGQGAVFQIYLPTFTGSIIPPPAATPLKQLPHGTGSVLVVEDEPPVRNFVCQLLRRLGYTVWEASDGVTALELWPQHSQTISLVLTDIIMPGGISGQELAARLQAQTPDLKIIFTSGYTGKGAAIDNFLVEGSNFLRKPFDPAALAEIVRQKMSLTSNPAPKGVTAP